VFSARRPVPVQHRPVPRGSTDRHCLIAACKDQQLSERLLLIRCNPLAFRVSDTKFLFRPGTLGPSLSFARGYLLSMSQHSEERVTDAVVPTSATARVIPFERPQSELQKAVQLRAQETIDRERDRAASQKPPAWRRAIVLALAVVPVVLTFGAALGFMGALQQFNAAVFESAKSEAARAPQTTPSTGPAEPGVVLLESYDKSGGARQRAEPSPASQPNPQR
jgi:hypothetical protein